MAKKRGLGRGLEALLSTDLAEGKDGDDDLLELPLDKLKPGRYQPRVDMRKEALADLADSIKSQGLVQPIVVRPIANNGYEIIAGERRWRAAQMAGIPRIKAVVRKVADEAAMAMALIENIQREDLNPLEQAGAFRRLMDEFSMTHQQIANTVGRSRSAVSNLLRLLELEPSVKTYLSDGLLEMGHARALLVLPALKQRALARKIVSDKLSVRVAEKLSQLAQNKPATLRSVTHKDPDLSRLEEKITEKLAARVRITANAKGQGKVQIHFNSLDELDGIFDHIQ